MLWLVIWNIAFMTFQKQLGISSSQLFQSPWFFRGVGWNHQCWISWKCPETRSMWISGCNKWATGPFQDDHPGIKSGNGNSRIMELCSLYQLVMFKSSMFCYQTMLLLLNVLGYWSAFSSVSSGSLGWFRAIFGKRLWIRWKMVGQRSEIFQEHRGI